MDNDPQSVPLPILRPALFRASNPFFDSEETTSNNSHEGQQEIVDEDDSVEISLDDETNNETDTDDVTENVNTVDKALPQNYSFNLNAPLANYKIYNQKSQAEIQAMKNEIQDKKDEIERESMSQFVPAVQLGFVTSPHQTISDPNVIDFFPDDLFESTGNLISIAYNYGVSLVYAGAKRARNYLLSEDAKNSQGSAPTHEDILTFNGFTVKTNGQDLTLHSIQVNRDLTETINSQEGEEIFDDELPSRIPSQKSVTAVSRIRIIFKINPTQSSTVNKAEHTYSDCNDKIEPQIIIQERKWSMTYGNLIEKAVEIDLPGDVDPDSIVCHGPWEDNESLLVVEIP